MCHQKRDDTYVKAICFERFQELTKEVTKLGFKEETTKINDDATLLMSEFARILTVEAALRAARHASRSKTTHQVDAEDVEKALVHLVKKTFYVFHSIFCNEKFPTVRCRC